MRGPRFTRKTDKSIHTLQILATHEARQAAGRAEAGEAGEPPRLMFTNEIGGIVVFIAFTHRWDRMQEAAGVPHGRLREHRHPHVSILVWEGIDPGRPTSLITRRRAACLRPCSS